jgi:hypothetical protein
MMVVRTYLALSPIHGVGLFAAEPIAVGAPICVFDERYDLIFIDKEVETMPAPMQLFVRCFGFKDPLDPGFTFCDFDNGRFMNHSDTSNVNQVDGVNYAARDIPAGEELTCDYRLLGVWELTQPEEMNKSRN